MANITSVNVYMVNQNTPIPLTDVRGVGFPTAFGGMRLQDCSQDLTTRSLSTGVSVYSRLVDALGNFYYCRETVAQMITLFG